MLFMYQQMCMKMAELYHNRKLIGKYWANWHCLIENKWRERVEKACQLRAQEICHQLEEKYQHQMEEVRKKGSMLKRFRPIEIIDETFKTRFSCKRCQV